MGGRTALASLICAVAILGGAQVAVAQRTPIQIQCSDEADARGLHGKERKEFRRQCKDAAQPGAAPADRNGQPQPYAGDAPRIAAPIPSVAPRQPPAASPPAISSAHTAPTKRLDEHRVALVIGNSAYKNVPALANPKRDAESVAATLKQVGFETVTLAVDLGRDQLLQALRTFAIQAEKSDWAVIYYAGHGMEVAGVNYVIPIDATIASDRDMSFEAVPLDQVLNVAERARKLRLVVMDACRDNPFAAHMKRTLTVATRSVSRGLASVEPDAGTLVVFAAKDGEVALDGDSGHSPFATAFVKDVSVPGLEVRRLFDTVRDDVLEMTNGQQKPFSYGSISGRRDFYFVEK